MEVESLCDYCHRKPAVTNCEVCGASVCEDHKRDYGCDVCNGGRLMSGE